MRISVTERVVVTTCTRLDALQNSLRGRANHGHIGIIARIPKKQRRAKTLAVYCTAGPCLGEATAKKLAHKAWVQEAISLSRRDSRVLPAVERPLTPDFIPCSIYSDRGLKHSETAVGRRRTAGTIW